MSKHIVREQRTSRIPTLNRVIARRGQTGLSSAWKTFAQVTVAAINNYGYAEPHLVFPPTFWLIGQCPNFLETIVPKALKRRLCTLNIVAIQY